MQSSFLLPELSLSCAQEAAPETSSKVAQQKMERGECQSEAFSDFMQIIKVEADRTDYCGVI